jgi:tryptophanyl-tRNA synthetase
MFGTTFVLPEAWIPPAGARVMALDEPTQKMSKSLERPNSSILLIDPPEKILKKFKVAVTDSGRDIRMDPAKPAIANLLTIYSSVEGTPVAELEARFEGKGYGDFKVALAEVVVEALAPIRERYEGLMDDPAELERLVAQGAGRAAEVAERTMAEVRDRTGLGERPKIV